MEISQNCVAFSEYMDFKSQIWTWKAAWNFKSVPRVLKEGASIERDSVCWMRRRFVHWWCYCVHSLSCCVLPYWLPLVFQQEGGKNLRCLVFWERIKAHLTIHGDLNLYHRQFKETLWKDTFIVWAQTIFSRCDYLAN